MRRNLLILITALLLSCFLIGCEEKKMVVNVENEETIHNTVFGANALIKIGDGLWYDSTTRIVYWWNGSIAAVSYSSTAPSAYYAPNGKPYKYNPETNTFYEIDNEVN